MCRARTRQSRLPLRQLALWQATSGHPRQHESRDAAGKAYEAHAHARLTTTFEPPNIKTPTLSGRGQRKRTPVPIPDFRGSSPLKAQNWFAHYGLKPAIEDASAINWREDSIDQQPAPGTDVYVVKEIFACS